LAKKASDSGVAGAVDAYLAELTLDGRQKPLASLARLLAESLEAAPEYARARLAKELRELLAAVAELAAQAARESEFEERREARRRSARWAADG
jgi:NTP pyrophosphatase (non-canonical NTP hydrolase)